MQTGHGSTAGDHRSVSNGVDDRDPILTGNPPGGIAPLHLQQDIVADRRRDGRAAPAAVAAVLDHRGAHISRCANRREGEEQRVIALLPGDLPGLAGATRPLG